MGKLSRDVYMVSGGVTKFAKAHPDRTFQIMAVLILASSDIAYRLTDRPVKIIGMGAGTDNMVMEDRPKRKVPMFSHESANEELVEYYNKLLYPDVHSFNAGRVAAKKAYMQAGITDPLEELDFLEIYDAYTMSEAQTYEDLGLCQCGYSGEFIDKGYTFMPDIDYGLELTERGKLPVNPSGGLLACGHPIGATMWIPQSCWHRHLYYIDSR